MINSDIYLSSIPIYWFIEVLKEGQAEEQQSLVKQRSKYALAAIKLKWCKKMLENKEFSCWEQMCLRNWICIYIQGGADKSGKN